LISQSRGLGDVYKRQRSTCTLETITNQKTYDIKLSEQETSPTSDTKVFTLSSCYKLF
jgi:hypothetical protein